MKLLSKKTPIPVVLVSGFLGAGKTTLMRRLILDAHARGLKVSVIVNEFGVADVDSHILKEADADLVGSIAGGCACCTGQEEFLLALLDVVEDKTRQRPDVILVESSGLADPLLMIDSITVGRFLPVLRLGALITVVDASRFGYISEEALPLLLRQLQLANWVIANKMDKAWDKEDRLNRDKRNEDVVHEVQAVNAHAQVVLAKGCNVNLGDFWQHVLNHQPQAWPQRGSGEAPPHSHFQTAVVPIPRAWERKALEAELKQLPVDVWRAKGFVKLQGEEELHLLQYVGGAEQGEGDWQMTPYAIPAPYKRPEPSLVFIGPRLNRIQLTAQFAGQPLFKIHRNWS